MPIYNVHVYCRYRNNSDLAKLIPVNNTTHWIETDSENEGYVQNALHGYCGTYTHMLLSNAKEIFAQKINHGYISRLGIHLIFC